MLKADQISKKYFCRKPLDVSLIRAKTIHVNFLEILAGKVRFNSLLENRYLFLDNGSWKNSISKLSLLCASDLVMNESCPFHIKSYS